MRLGSRELAQAPFSAVSAPIGAIDFPAQNSRAGVTTQLRARRSVSRRTDPRLEPFCAIEYSTSKKSELHGCISKWGCASSCSYPERKLNRFVIHITTTRNSSPTREASRESEQLAQKITCCGVTASGRKRHLSNTVRRDRPRLGGEPKPEAK